MGGEISAVTEIEGGQMVSIRFDNSGSTLLVDPALAAPEPATGAYFLFGVAAIGLARSIQKRKRIGAR